MSTTMRAKMKLMTVSRTETCDVMTFMCVSAKSYPTDGIHEDNTFSKFSPSGELKINVTNPALLGHIQPGVTFYVDFSPVPADKL